MEPAPAGVSATGGVVVKALMHNWKAGGYAASADRGRTWRWYGGNCSSSIGPESIDWSRSAWPPTVRMNGTDGVVLTPHRRERPHVVLGPDGTLQAITTSVQFHPPPQDATWTLVQRVKSSVREIE